MAGDWGWRKERYPLHAMLTRHVGRVGGREAQIRSESARKGRPYSIFSQRRWMHPTQEFLSMMLGVRRPGVTVAATILQQTGAISYTRGRITVLDRKRLEETSCECYNMVKEQFDQLFGSIQVSQGAGAPPEGH
jgi:hypothetical protein